MGQTTNSAFKKYTKKGLLENKGKELTLIRNKIMKRKSVPDQNSMYGSPVVTTAHTLKPPLTSHDRANLKTVSACSTYAARMTADGFNRPIQPKIVIEEHGRAFTTMTHRKDQQSLN
jgi:hypothetical protein